MIEFLLGIFIAKTFLSDGSSHQNADPKQTKRKPRHVPPPRRLTKTEQEQQARENRRDLTYLGIVNIAAVPLFFVLVSTFGGLIVTNISCSYEQVCLKKNFQANIETFGQHIVLATRQPAKTMLLIQPRYYLPYGLGLFTTYILLFVAALSVLYFLVSGVSFVGSRMWLLAHRKQD